VFAGIPGQAQAKMFFERVVRGEQNPTTAYMSGKLKIKGDMGAAMKLQKLF
jgi:putative sterol carrier protein